MVPAQGVFFQGWVKVEVAFGQREKEGGQSARPSRKGTMSAKWTGLVRKGEILGVSLLSYQLHAPCFMTTVNGERITCLLTIDRGTEKGLPYFVR